MEIFFTLPRVSAHKSFKCSDKTCAVSVLNSFEKIAGYSILIELLINVLLFALIEKCHIKEPKSQSLVRYSYAANVLCN